MIKIERDSDIFNTKPFVDDEITFNLMHLIKECKEATLLRSENGKCIFAQSAPQYQAWVWTDKKIDKEDYMQIAKEFYTVFLERDDLKFIAKPEVAKFIAQHYAEQKNIEWKVAMSMESYYCPKIISPSNDTGIIDRPSKDDTLTIAKFFVGFVRDCFNVETSIDKQMKNAETYIASPNFYVWKDNNEIVSMANIAHVSSRHGRLNEVYTPPKARKKGYAGALVSELSKILKARDRGAMLYTNLSNPASNKAYKNVGFIECGQVDQIDFIKPN